MHTINLTKQQLNNLKLFLDRVDLKGSEVPAYYDVACAVYSAVLIETPIGAAGKKILKKEVDADGILGNK